MLSKSPAHAFLTSRSCIKMVRKRAPISQELETHEIFYIPETMSFVDACARLSVLDVDIHYRRIKEALTSFTVRIYGLPDCRDEDLLLSVYLLLEESLGIKASIEMCARTRDRMVGVVFHNIKTKNDVLNRSYLLCGVQPRIVANNCIKFILENWTE